MYMCIYVYICLKPNKLAVSLAQDLPKPSALVPPLKTIPAQDAETRTRHLTTELSSIPIYNETVLSLKEKCVKS